MSNNIPSLKLNSGHEMPMIGYGTFGGHDVPEIVYNAVKVALRLGYKHIDTAYIYGTEDAVGKAIRESKSDRKDLFITTKLWQFFHEPQHVRPAFQKSLDNLKMDYVDLYLIHWPFSWKFKGYELSDCEDNNHMEVTNVPIIDTWREMEKIYKEGKAKSIGVSNFTIPMLEELLSQCEIPPAVNQVEIHPALPQDELLAYCKNKNIALTAYSPLANPGYRNNVGEILEKPIIMEIAKDHDRSPAQVILNWGINRGYAVIPKSVTPSRIEDNLTYFKLSQKELDAISAIGAENIVRTCKPEASWGPQTKIWA
ncbi:NADP-dependent oxidoreductase domain-containing protein [Pilobolus umbonatus]|nr:NADP-dependent oxidoreductase domain-containing protein [Pilobolus umbonatus]